MFLAQNLYALFEISSGLTCQMGKGGGVVVNSVAAGQPDGARRSELREHHMFIQLGVCLLKSGNSSQAEAARLSQTKHR